MEVYQQPRGAPETETQPVEVYQQPRGAPAPDFLRRRGVWRGGWPVLRVIFLPTRRATRVILVLPVELLELLAVAGLRSPHAYPPLPPFGT